MSYDSDESVAAELILYADNESSLYGQKKSIIANLTRRFKKGTYDHSLAPKIWGYWVESAAKKYVKEYSSDPKAGGIKWSDMFTVPVRKLAAKELADRWYDNAKAGYPDEG